MTDEAWLIDKDPFYEIAVDKEVSFYVTTLGAANPKWVLASHFFEREIRQKWFKVKQDDVVLDIGAGYGSWTLWTLALGVKSVIAWEPAKDELFTLLSCLLLNDFTGTLTIIPAVAGDLYGVTEGYFPDSHSWRPQGVGESRFIVPIDDMVAGKKLERVDWIKIDVEGSEIQVLEGAKVTLKTHNPTLIIEMHTGIVPNIIQQVEAILLPLGYERLQAAKVDHEKIDTHLELWRKPK